MDDFRYVVTFMPGTPNNQFKMDGNGETTFFHVKILNHPIETTVYKWMFQVRGVGVSQKRPNSFLNTKHQTKLIPKNGRAPCDPQKFNQTSTHNSSVRGSMVVVSTQLNKYYIVKLDHFPIGVKNFLKPPSRDFVV